jgi:hypothetical protein
MIGRTAVRGLGSGADVHIGGYDNDVIAKG